MLTVPWFVTQTVKDLFRIQTPRLSNQDDTEDPGPVPEPVAPDVGQPVEAEVTQTRVAHSQTQGKQAVSTTPQVAAPASGGKMSVEWVKQQVEKFKFDFDEADTDKSGSLSFDEVLQVLRKSGFKGSEDEAQVPPEREAYIPYLANYMIFSIVDYNIARKSFYIIKTKHVPQRRMKVTHALRVGVEGTQ
ncbi:uncharacterized protein LOC131929605, partial [Physella acuta]|uniref:uncharacterized protein LOC131929605 n=1 Tax=Physella acuta TaxID=109671 RepID=UPI0027DE05AD